MSAARSVAPERMKPLWRRTQRSIVTPAVLRNDTAVPPTVAVAVRPRDEVITVRSSTVTPTEFSIEIAATVPGALSTVRQPLP